MSLYEMRRSYKLGSLNETDIDPDPMVQFQTWLQQAMEGDLPDWVEVNAMTLSTTEPDGRVSSRIVLLKGLDKGKFWFYTNYASDKGRQIADNAHVALCFLWQHNQRQVRVEGIAEPAPREQSVRYFRTRPRESQLGALVSDQSTVIESRKVLETRLQELTKKYADGDIPCPEQWGGYGVTPLQVEFWQGREKRLHDRLRYRRGEDNRWLVERLAP
ncbi:pyridoxamine 5'-phosphate oxidase [Roseiconus nitratireducens]|uniref:Pyridoxine/pyridoxamine 5'-phosphate oxidase n=1 Tax=Roseiconus nitratireducens TaxID=2605748 RepID=A0A5M6D0J3_9BACT|nr:pyridoxamine 5'-phosphate oxidase [Roseiconus nitratireducens]KAA5541007.1 pyridoxamine 5'-phosphate oxidase [Roseiconus nitratireducens]